MSTATASGVPARHSPPDVGHSQFVLSTGLASESDSIECPPKYFADLGPALPDSRPLHDFVRKTTDQSLRVAIIGLGYVGLPLLLRFADMGFRVIGIDRNAAKVALMNEGRSPIRHIRHQALESLVAASRNKITTDYTAVRQADAVILCLPTPLTGNRQPDLSYVTAAADAVVANIRRGQLIVLESTVYPGATEEIFLSRLVGRGLRPGEDVHLAYSPEREDPGNTDFSWHNTPKLCAGLTPSCYEMAAAMFNQIIGHVVPVSSIRVAEMSKLLENIQRSVNIGLINEMKVLADHMDIDIHEVVAAAATKPFGFMPYHPGPGLGGHCIPIDPLYLSWKAKEYGAQSRFIELAGEINAAMPDYVVAKIVAGLNDVGKAVRESRILVCGLAYKKNVDDMRESPTLSVVQRLIRMGGDISVTDAYVSDRSGGEIPSEAKRVACDVETLERQDCVVIATDHDYFDYKLILATARLIVDCRGRYPRRTSKVVVA